MCQEKQMCREMCKLKEMFKTYQKVRPLYQEVTWPQEIAMGPFDILHGWTSSELSLYKRTLLYRNTFGRNLVEIRIK